MLPLQPGSEERKADQHQRIEIREKEEKKIEKIKFILFGSLKKFLTFALPTERKGKKIGTADVGKITKKIEMNRNTERRTRLFRTEV